MDGCVKSKKLVDVGIMNCLHLTLAIPIQMSDQHVQIIKS